MAKYVTDSEFKRLVRVCLNQNMSSEALAALEDVDTLSLDEIIDSKAEDAALTVVRIAPIDKLGDITTALEGQINIGIGERKKVTMVVPHDFARLVRFKMASWPRAVYGSEPPISPYYEQAHSAFNIFGTRERPVVFLVPSPSGGLCLEAFCAGSESDTTDGCLYVKKPKMVHGDGVDASSEIELGDDLVRPTVYYAAYLTALAIKDADAAAALKATAREILEII